jgi:hypothetical protein
MRLFCRQPTPRPCGSFPAAQESDRKPKRERDGPGDMSKLQATIYSLIISLVIFGSLILWAEIILNRIYVQFTGPYKYIEGYHFAKKLYIRQPWRNYTGNVLRLKIIGILFLWIHLIFMLILIIALFPFASWVRSLLQSG